VSSEISGGKFPEIYSNLTGNLLITYVNQLFLSPQLQSDAKNEHVLDKQLFRSLCINLMHYIQKKNNFFAQLSGILASSNESHSRYNFLAFAYVSLNFQKLSGNIKFRENLQP